MAPEGKHCLHAYLPATEPYHIWKGVKKGRCGRTMGGALAGLECTAVAGRSCAVCISLPGALRGLLAPLPGRRHCLQFMVIGFADLQPSAGPV